MKDEFGLEARLYDKVWGKYDYDRDVKFLDGLFRRNGCRSVIDVGCGTGNHSVRLSKLGYAVTGIDISQSMLRIARKKSAKAKVRFLHGDMRKLTKMTPKSRKFDAAICLGQVFSHLMADKDVRTFLIELHKILRRNGLFVFCARNAKKINDEYLDRLRLDHIANEEKLQLVMLSYNSRDLQDRSVLVWRPIYLLKEDGKMDLQVREHKLRWFEFLRLKEMVEKGGFEIAAVYSGPVKKKFRENDHEDMWFVTNAK